MLIVLCVVQEALSIMSHRLLSYRVVSSPTLSYHAMSICQHICLAHALRADEDQLVRRPRPPTYMYTHYVLCVYVLMELLIYLLIDIRVRI